MASVALHWGSVAHLLLHNATYRRYHGDTRAEDVENGFDTKAKGVLTGIAIRLHRQTASHGLFSNRTP